MYYARLRTVLKFKRRNRIIVSCATIVVVDQYVLHSNTLQDVASIFDTAARTLNTILRRQRKTGIMEDLVWFFGNRRRGDMDVVG